MKPLHARPLTEWPKDLRRRYEQLQAFANFWGALAEHPIIRRIGIFRTECERRQVVNLAHAVLAEREARELLALADQARRKRTPA